VSIPHLHEGRAGFLGQCRDELSVVHAARAFL
jgi:hypothetical protein